MNVLRADTLVGLPTAMLDALMPMHMIIGATGHIRHAGPTLDKLRPVGGFRGARFLEAFELRRPRNINQISALRDHGAGPLTLRLRDRADVPLKGLSVPLPDHSDMLINLSFGISAAEAVVLFNLSAGDFSATDLTIEMLYLVEAKEAVMKESRNLIARLQDARQEAEQQAISDTLTGLKNRRAMDTVLNQFNGGRLPLAIMHIDLDFFKQVNDTLGHAAGDHVLQEVASILTAETRAGDSVVRFGGDEFVVVFPSLTDRKQLADISGRILGALKKPILFEDQICRIAGSIGIAVSDDYPVIDPDQMLLDADAALYASKHAGRGQYTFWRDIEDNAD